jgi:hypothetical protein
LVAVAVVVVVAVLPAGRWLGLRVGEMIEVVGVLDLASFLDFLKHQQQLHDE